MTQHDVDRRLLMQGSFGAFAGLAAFATDLHAQDSSGADAEAYAEIDAILKKTEELYNTQQSVKEIWDEEDPNPFYVAEELREPIVGWDALNHYMNPERRGMLDTFRWGYSNLRVRLLCPDISLALFDHWFEILIARDGQVPRAGFDRVLAMYRKRPEGWKQFLYAQCPYGPYEYVQELRERAVRPDFEEFRARTKSINDN